jgi:hypothetical protein
MKAIWISLSALVLAGCLKGGPEAGAQRPDSGGAFFLSGLLQGGDKAAPLSKAMLAGGITLKTPKGYCIDPETLKRNFAILASCKALSNGRRGPDVPMAMMTVSVSGRSENSELPTAAQFAQSMDAQMLGGQSSGQYVSGNVKGQDSSVPEGSDPRHWRGAFTLGDRMVGLGLYAPKGSPLTGAKGGTLLAKTARSMSILPTSASKSAATPSEKSEVKKEGLLAGLFNR